MPNFEYERKFLVSDLSVISGEDGTRIYQGYLGAAEGHSVRVRYSPDPDPATRVDATQDSAWPVTDYVLTAKGPREGPRRSEEECCIPPEVGQAVLAACGSSLISKDRHPVAGPDGNIWVIDVFHGLNEGLVLAELEQDQPSSYEKPEWCGEDVTDDERYYNDYLSRKPFTTWTS